MIDTPYGHTKPTRRRDRAESHFCREVGSTLFCPAPDCPYCGEEEPDD